MICGDVENFQTSRFCSQHISSPSTPPTLTTLPLPTSLHHLQGKHREPAWQNYSFLCFDHLLKMPFWRGWGLDYWKRIIHRVPLLHQHFVKQSLCPKCTDAQFYSLSPVPCQNKVCCKCHLFSGKPAIMRMLGLYLLYFCFHNSAWHTVCPPGYRLT